MTLLSRLAIGSDLDVCLELRSRPPISSALFDGRGAVVSSDPLHHKELRKARGLHLVLTEADAPNLCSGVDASGCMPSAPGEAIVCLRQSHSPPVAAIQAVFARGERGGSDTPEPFLFDWNRRRPHRRGDDRRSWIWSWGWLRGWPRPRKLGLSLCWERKTPTHKERLRHGIEFRYVDTKISQGSNRIVSDHVDQSRALLQYGRFDLPFSVFGIVRLAHRRGQPGLTAAAADKHGHHPRHPDRISHPPSITHRPAQRCP